MRRSATSGSGPLAYPTAPPSSDVDHVPKTVTANIYLNQRYGTVLADASGGAFTIYLPTTTEHQGRQYKIIKVDGSANLVTVDGNGNLINGLALTTLSNQFDCLVLTFDGTSWSIVGGAGSAAAGGSTTVDAEPMGFPVQDDSYTTWSWTNGTNTFAIAPVGASFDVWVKGKKYTKTGAESKVIVPAEGIWFFYYDATGTLQGTQVPFDLSVQAPVALGYYDATLGDMIFLADERHGLAMSWATHYYLHTTRGFSIDPSGFLISGTIAGDGSLDVDAQIGLGTGQGHDEDILVNVLDGAVGTRFQQPLSLPAQVPVYYRNGVSTWRRKVANTFALLEDGVNRIKYNLNTAGVWSQPNVTANGRYMAVWICATNNYAEPIVAILGQREDITLADAQNNNDFGSLLLTGFPAAELKVLWRVIYQTSTTYANTPHARTRDFLDYRDVSSLPSGTATVTAHNALSGRTTFPAHPGSALQRVASIVNSSPVTLGASEDLVLVDASGGARLVNLPAAASHVGRVYTIKKTDATGNTVTLDGNAAELVEGAATLVLTVPNEVVTIVSDGTAWYVI